MKIASSWTSRSAVLLALLALMTLQGSASAGKKSIKVSIESVQKSYASDETVNFVITVKNTSKKPQILKFHSAQQYDVVVTSEKTQKKVWRWSYNQKFKINKADNGDVTLAPGQTLTFDVPWYQVDETKTHVPAGPYSARATLTSDDPIKSSTVNFLTTTQ